MAKNLTKMFNPKSIAIVGASQKPDSVGLRLINNIINSDFSGDIYPVNPKYDEILGKKCYKSVCELPKIPDLSIIAIPAIAVYENIVQSAKVGIKNFYIISAGFGEMGAEGKKIEQSLATLATENNLSIVGPNTIGFVNNEIGLNANFSQSKCHNGNAVLISQSGALASGIMNIFDATQVGLKYCVSLGNQCDVDFADLIEYFGSQKNIEVIMLYMETVKNPSKMIEICKKVNKKIICIKSGTSTRGAQAASSHTGALASSDVITDAYLHQCGIIRVDSIDALVAVASLLSTTKVSKKIDSVAIITNAGGPAIMTVDALSKYNVNLYDFTENEKSAMREYLQKQASVKNPVDMVASASVDDYKRTLNLCLNNENIDAIICIHLFIMGTKSQEIAQILENLKLNHPNKCIIGTFITNEESFDEIKKMNTHFPVYDSTDLAVLALSKANSSISTEKSKIKQIKNRKIEKIVSLAQAENRMLTTFESLNVLKELDLPLVKYAIAKDIPEAISVASSIGYPMAIKITSKTITHKSDVGGVKVGITNEKELIDSINEILNNLKKKHLEKEIDGFILQEMKSSKREFVYGIVKDKNFGLCSMFGLGGIFVEAMNDVSFKVLPTNEQDIEEQISALRTSKLLGNIRNLPATNMEQLKDVMQKINNFATSFNISELDLNPLLIDDADGSISLIDARIKM